jgi:hypothetical protein
MPVKQIFDSRDAAPEWLRPALLEDGNGKFVFEAETTVEVAGLKKALDDERTSRADFEKKLSALKGVDPEEYKRLKAEADKVAADKLKNQGNWEEREKQLKDQLAADLAARETQFKTELDAATQRQQKLQSSLERYLIESQAAAAMAEPGKPKGNPVLLMPHIQGKVKVFEENGEFVARVVDSAGKPRIANVKGDPFTINMLLDEMRSDAVFKAAFEASGAHGTGAPVGSTGAVGSAITLTSAQAKDPAIYRQAKEAAAKSGSQVVITD